MTFLRNHSHTTITLAFALAISPLSASQETTKRAPAPSSSVSDIIVHHPYWLSGTVFGVTALGTGFYLAHKMAKENILDTMLENQEKIAYEIIEDGEQQKRNGHDISASHEYNAAVAFLNSDPQTRRKQLQLALRIGTAASSTITGLAAVASYLLVRSGLLFFIDLPTTTIEAQEPSHSTHSPIAAQEAKPATDEPIATIKTEESAATTLPTPTTSDAAQSAAPTAMTNNIEPVTPAPATPITPVDNAASTAQTPPAPENTATIAPAVDIAQNVPSQVSNEPAPTESVLSVPDAAAAQSAPSQEQSLVKAPTQTQESIPSSMARVQQFMLEQVKNLGHTVKEAMATSSFPNNRDNEDPFNN